MGLSCRDFNICSVYFCVVDSDLEVVSVEVGEG